MTVGYSSLHVDEKDNDVEAGECRMSIHVPKAVAHGGNKAVRAALVMVMDRAKLFRFLLVAVVAVAAAAALGACSLKKNTAALAR